jgi:hypothetical protein
VTWCFLHIPGTTAALRQPILHISIAHRLQTKSPFEEEEHGGGLFVGGDGAGEGYFAYPMQILHFEGESFGLSPTNFHFETVEAQAWNRPMTPMTVDGTTVSSDCEPLVSEGERGTVGERERGRARERAEERKRGSETGSEGACTAWPGLGPSNDALRSSNVDLLR